MLVVDFSLILLLLIFLICAIITFIICKKTQRKYSLITYLFVEAYILLMIKVVIMPIYLLSTNVRKEWMQGMKGLASYGIQLVPFRAIYNVIEIPSIASVIQIVGNLLLLMPLAFLMSWVFAEKSKFMLEITGLLATELIECIQLIINVITRYPGHAVDIDDVIFNYIGYIAAVGILSLIKKNHNKIYQKMRRRL